MDEYLIVLTELGEIRENGGEFTKETLRKMEAFIVCKMIELGAEYGVVDDNVAFMIGDRYFSCSRKDAEKYMREDWFKFVFSNEMFYIDEEEHPQYSTTRTVSKKKVVDFTTKTTIQMKKKQFTYKALAIKFFEGKKATSIRVMSAPIDNIKTLFWISTENQKEKIQVTNGVAIIDINNNNKCILKRTKDELFRIEVTTSPGCRVEISEGSGGTEGHLYICNNGAELHIIPKNYRTDATGAANLIYYVRDEETEMMGEGNSFQYGDKVYQINAWWEGEDKTLNVDIEAF